MWETLEIELAGIRSRRLCGYAVPRCQSIFAITDSGAVSFAERSRHQRLSCRVEVDRSLGQPLCHVLAQLDAKLVELRYMRGNGGYVVLPSGEQLPVSRNKKDELLDRLGVL